jgi:hypothetical protein
LCCVINRAMRRSAWWLVADCLPCTLHVRTPPISQLPTAPPHLLFLLSAGLRVAVDAATNPHYHPLVLPHHQPTLPAPPMPTLCCPAATALVVLLRSYLQPPHPPCLLSTRLRVAVGAATDPYYHSLVLPRHQSTLPSPPMPSYTMLPCSPQLPTPRLPPSVFPRSSFGSTADHGHYH